MTTLPPHLSWKGPTSLKSASFSEFVKLIWKFLTLFKASKTVHIEMTPFLAAHLECFIWFDRLVLALQQYGHRVPFFLGSAGSDLEAPAAYGGKYWFLS